MERSRVSNTTLGLDINVNINRERKAFANTHSKMRRAIEMLTTLATFLARLQSAKSKTRIWIRSPRTSILSFLSNLVKHNSIKKNAYMFIYTHVLYVLVYMIIP